MPQARHNDMVVVVDDPVLGQIEQVAPLCASPCHRAACDPRHLDSVSTAPRSSRSWTASTLGRPSGGIAPCYDSSRNLKNS